MTKRMRPMFASLFYLELEKSFPRARGKYHGIDTNRIADMISEIINTGKKNRFTI